MGRPNRTIAIAEEVHAAFQEAGATNVPRDRFDSVIQKHYRIGGQQAYRVAADGEALGLWTRHRSLKDGVGWIEIQPNGPTPQAMGQHSNPMPSEALAQPG